MIRPLRSSDRPELLRLWLALFPDDTDAERDVDAYVSGARPTATVLVAPREHGRLCGFIEVGSRPYAEGCVTSPVGYIEAWYVDPDVRRTGVGGALVRAAEAWAREQGFREIASDALIDNEVSIAAHQALGYHEVERQVCFRRDL